MNKKEEIFTIGDKTNNGTISKFEIDSNGVRVFFEEKPKNYHVSLNSIKHSKQKLFTTEDGVDIFEGDKIYWVNINTFEKVNCNKYNDDLGEISIKSLLSKKYECKAIAFSTKEKAKEYILLNKPCLSLQEIKETTTIKGLSLKKLEKLVQQKLK